MKGLFCMAAVTAAVLGLTLVTFAQKDPCAPYYGKGYCTDYVKQRSGRRPSGDAGTWQGNVQPKDIKDGDAAIFSSPAPWGHVAIIDRVIYRANTAIPIKIDISEWNWGAASSDATERKCAVTKMFGKRGTRTVNVSDAKGFWRP